ncbi:DUF4266 domain-containing protein [bacterium]|nr:DUF4266 domain-containing protein [bacterium]
MRPFLSPRPAALLVLLITLALAGCSLGTEAWERDLHADPEMALDHDAIDQALDEHIYFSKEASSGGQGFGGGGCGCN